MTQPNNVNNLNTHKNIITTTTELYMVASGPQSHEKDSKPAAPGQQVYMMLGLVLF